MLLVPQVKLGMPLLPADFVERGELLAELDAAAAAGTTLVCAPPGYGKTLVLTDWASRPPPVETAWVTIDGGDNDPRRLWASIVAALAGHSSFLSTLDPSSLAWSAAEHTQFVAELVDELDSLPNPIRLILDDVDELTDPEALRGLRILAGNVSSQVHLALSSRLDPPLGLGRLRRSGRLREIRADRLRFTSAESATLFARAGLRVTAPQLQRLHRRRTNGWAAGLRLAALALTDVPDPERFIAEFATDRRCVADYLTGEILSRLRPDTLAFLRAISIADPISPELAVALSGRADAGALLDSLEHDTSLLSAVDRQRDAYRLQPQLRTYLLADLATRRTTSCSAGSSTGLDGHAVIAPAAHLSAHDL